MDESKNSAFYFIPFYFELTAIVIFIIVSSRLNFNELLIGLLLLASCIMDIWAGTINGYNQWFYNYSMAITIFLIGVFYLKILKSKIVKKITIWAIVIFLVSHVINMIVGQDRERLLTFTILPGEAFIGFLSFIYMRQKVESSDVNPFHDFIFWFSMANLINFFAIIPVHATLNWFSYEHNKIADKLYNINGILGYYFYFPFIIIGLLWTRKYQV